VPLKVALVWLSCKLLRTCRLWLSASEHLGDGLHAGVESDVARVAFRLAASHSETDLGNPADPLDDLIYIVLSGQTNEANYLSTFALLNRGFPKWKGLASAKPKRVESLLRGGGLASQKAAYLIGLLKRIETDFGKPTLSPLANWSTEKAERYLTSLPGVGIKSARCVLMYTMRRDVFSCGRELPARHGSSWLDQLGGKARRVVCR